MDPKVKAARIEKVEAKIKDLTDKRAEAKAKADKTHARKDFQAMPTMLAELRKLDAELAALNIETRWLRGEVTLTKAEDAVTCAKKALDAAEAKEAPAAEASTLREALKNATAIRDAIKTLEELAAKTPEPN